MIPQPETVLAAGDEILALAAPEAEDAFRTAMMAPRDSDRA